MPSKFLQIDPVQQTGENCKIIAISCIANYWAKLRNTPPIYPHKNKNRYYRNMPTSNRSVRQIAKKHGSIQGELLEYSQVTNIFKEIGCTAKDISVINDQSYFKDLVIKNINAGKPLLCFFAVSILAQPDIFTTSENNEHAAVISGYEEEGDRFKVQIIHWGRKHMYNIESLHASMCSLPNQREPETYYYRKNKYKPNQYNISNRSRYKPGDTALKSIVPQGNSGFKGMVFEVEGPNVQCSKAALEEKNRDTSIYFKLLLGLVCFLIIPTILLVVLSIVMGPHILFSSMLNEICHANSIAILALVGITALSGILGCIGFKAGGSSMFFNEKFQPNLTTSNEQPIYGLV